MLYNDYSVKFNNTKVENRSAVSNRKSNITFAAKTKNNTPVIDVKARAPYPANVLSNFFKTNFEFDGVHITSLEGLFQALKVNDPEMQRKLCAMSGFEAKAMAKSIRRDNGDVMCFWNGKRFAKSSPEFKELITALLHAKDKTFNGKYFIFQGRKVASVNSFILSLKVQDPALQYQLAMLPESKVKEVAKHIKPTYVPRTLYWKGKPFSRDSLEYKQFLKRVYKERFKNDPEFRSALRSTDGFLISHSVGKSSIYETVLTADEFVEMLQMAKVHDSSRLKFSDSLFMIFKKLLKK